MKSIIVGICIFVTSFAVAQEAKEFPIDEDAVLVEVEALIDRTPAPTADEAKRIAKLIQKGVKAHDAGRYDKALEFYASALELDPIAALVYYEIALTQYKSGELVAALESLTRAILIDPKMSLSRVQRASVLDDLGFPERALADYDAILALEPNSYIAHLNRGVTLARAGRWDEAEVAYKSAMEANPTSPSPYFHLGHAARVRGFNYEEIEMLEGFLERGDGDPRKETVEARLKELQTETLEMDPSHPYVGIEMLYKMERALWKTETHRERFPEARGYQKSYEEESTVLGSLVTQWREKKAEEPDAKFGFYDLLLAIDDAGFLDEYIYYVNQRNFPEAPSWMEEHADRIDAFKVWATEAGFLNTDKGGEAEAEEEELSFHVALLSDLVNAVEESPLLYVLGGESEIDPEWMRAQGRRFAKGYKLKGENKLACSKLAREMGTSHLPSILPGLMRCFTPDSPEYKQAKKLSATAGLQLNEIVFQPPVQVIEAKSEITVLGDGPWLAYSMARAAWPRETGMREEWSDPDPGPNPSYYEELFSLGAVLRMYEVMREPNEEDEDDEPIEVIPELERLAAALASGHFKGYALYEVIHKLFGVALDKLTEDQAEDVEGYLHRYVILQREAS